MAKARWQFRVGFALLAVTCVVQQSLVGAVVLVAVAVAAAGRL